MKFYEPTYPHNHVYQQYDSDKQPVHQIALNAFSMCPRKLQFVRLSK